MIRLRAEEAGRALGREALREDVARVTIDSRRVTDGDLFVALKGERHDGHDYLDEAFARGASAAVVSREWFEGGTPAAARMVASAGDSLYPVPDTTAALGALARAVRRRSRATVVAVTGSVGKTGTKDLLRAMAATVVDVAATSANENNEIGVPLTLLSIEPNTEMVIVEMGMRGRGQIARLAAIAEPDVGVVTNVAPVHLELLGTVEEVARAKAEVLEGLGGDGVGVIPVDSPLLEGEAVATGVHLVRFQAQREPSSRESPQADVRLGYHPIGEASAHITVSWAEGEARTEVPWSGRGRMENAAAACAALLVSGLPLVPAIEGLAETRFSPYRGEERESPGGILVLNDSYNSNPVAVEAALEGLRERVAMRRGRAVAVLGDMLELGPEAERYHADVGRTAWRSGVEVLVGVGSLSKAMVESFLQEARVEDDGKVAAVHGSDVGEILDKLQDLLRPGDVVLIKGSRGMRLERVADFLTPASASPSDSSGVG